MGEVGPGKARGHMDSRQGSIIRRMGESADRGDAVRGVLVVYVDDFLLQMELDQSWVETEAYCFLYPMYLLSLLLIVS